jgi:hypothetical protein
MLGRLRDALQRRQAAVVQAEALVWGRGARGVAMALHPAENPHQRPDQRRHWRTVLRIAKRRLAHLDGLDTATMYAIGDTWVQRPGSLIR